MNEKAFGTARQARRSSTRDHHADSVQLSPCLTAHISRFGLYATHALRLRPDDFRLRPTREIDFAALAEAA